MPKTKPQGFAPPPAGDLPGPEPFTGGGGGVPTDLRLAAKKRYEELEKEITDKTKEMKGLEAYLLSVGEMKKQKRKRTTKSRATEL